MTPTRFKVLKHYFSQRNGVKPGEIINFFFAPSYKTIANKFIQRKEQVGDYYKVYFHETDDPLYYPVELNQHSLHQVIVECFNPQNWHYYEIPETTVTRDDIVLDCGAAEGLFALKIQKRCKRIYLIEPFSKFISSLEKTFEKANNITIMPLAISDSEYSTKIKSNDISSSLSDEGDGENVEVTTLDKLFFDKEIPVTYLKLDLEGYDYKALAGAKKLIEKYKPKIAVTTYHDKGHATQIEQLLKSIVPGYKILCKGIYQETGSPVMLHAWI